MTDNRIKRRKTARLSPGRPARSYSAFTIVELLIVIVVIAILAAISIVAYNGIQTRATDSITKTDVSSAAKQLGILHSTEGYYPEGDGGDLGSLERSDTTSYQYTSDGENYILTASSSRDNTKSYCISSWSQSPTEGACEYHIDSGSGGDLNEPYISSESSCYEIRDVSGGVSIVNYRSGTGGYSGFSFNPECPLDVVIPSTIDGKSVVELEGVDYPGESSAGSFGYRYITSVVIPNTVKKIGRFAFHAHGLTSLTIPSSVEIIGEAAFAGGSELSSASVSYQTELEVWAFDPEVEIVRY